MDNLSVRVRAPEGPAAIRNAVELLMIGHSKATHYQDKAATGEQPRTLVLYWVKHEDATPLPVPLDAEGVSRLVQDWLSGLDDDERTDLIDMDGDCVPEAFTAWNEEWGHVDGKYQAFMAVHGSYAWYGK